MHEIGHSFSYSGSGNDNTRERISNGIQEWSIVRSGWNDEAVRSHDGAIYYAFSIEETSSVTEP